MVIQEDDIPIEVSVTRKPIYKPNHVHINKPHREPSKIYENEYELKISSEHSTQIDEICERDVQKKDWRKNKKKENMSSSSENDDNNQCSTSEISARDLEELRTVYRKCKAVIKKIENKYGHLLELDSRKSRETLKRSCQEEFGTKCECSINKKIVFDEDGKEKTVEIVSDQHICAKTLKLERKTYTERKNIEIEYNDSDISLPDNLAELAVILQNPNIETTYRNKILDKVRCLKQEYSNEIKFDKHSIVEKLKSNPDELLDFKGTNLSSLSGYS